MSRKNHTGIKATTIEQSTSTPVPMKAGVSTKSTDGDSKSKKSAVAIASSNPSSAFKRTAAALSAARIEFWESHFGDSFKDVMLRDIRLLIIEYCRRRLIDCESSLFSFSHMRQHHVP